MTRYLSKKCPSNWIVRSHTLHFRIRTFRKDNAFDDWDSRDNKKRRRQFLDPIIRRTCNEFDYDSEDSREDDSSFLNNKYLIFLVNVKRLRENWNDRELQKCLALTNIFLSFSIICIAARIVIHTLDFFTISWKYVFKKEEAHKSVIEFWSYEKRIRRLWWGA